MKRLLLARLADLAVVLFGVSVIVFLMIRLIPGDAVAIMLGANTEVTPDRIAELRARIGLDRSLPDQYLRWAAAALRGDLGTSLWTGRPVAAEILTHLWPTLELTHPRSRARRRSRRAGRLPDGADPRPGRGHRDARRSHRRPHHPVLLARHRADPSHGAARPGLRLARLRAVFGGPPRQPAAHAPAGASPWRFPILANLSRLVRSAMLDCLGQDYIRTARAKGASERLVVYKHALRNALIPFVTSVGIMTGYLLGGAIVVEQVFAIPGLGRLILGAIAERNYPLIQATILVVTVGFVLVNFLVDLLYAVIDPRVRV